MAVEAQNVPTVKSVRWIPRRLAIRKVLQEGVVPAVLRAIDELN